MIKEVPSISIPILQLNDTAKDPTKPFITRKLLLEAAQFIKSQINLDEKTTPQLAIIDFHSSFKLPQGSSVIADIAFNKIPHIKFFGKKNPSFQVCKLKNGVVVFRIFDVAYDHEFSSAVDLTSLIRVFIITYNFCNL